MNGKPFRISMLVLVILIFAGCGGHTFQYQKDLTSPAGALESGYLAVRFISSILSRPEDFSDFSKQFLYTSTLNLTDRALKRYWVSKEDRKAVAPEAARAYAAHLAGDEQRPASILDTDPLGLWGGFIMWMRRDLIEAWYTDLPPSDNTVTIDLKTGQYISDPNTQGG